MSNEGRNILLIVEGERSEVRLFEKILSLFPEIKLNPNNILVYNTNIWVLNKSLEDTFGTDWYNSKDIEFLEFIESKFPKIKGKKITDIFLVFDYERQDFRFCGDKLEKMCQFFNNSVENGQLYINYPMVESYKHFTCSEFPDDEYKNRICKVEDITKYKNTVGQESKQIDLRKYTRAIFQQIIIHNIKKASFIISNKFDLNKSEILNYCNYIDSHEIVKKQNEHSLGAERFVYVLCTCLFFISDYNRNLLYD